MRTITSREKKAFFITASLVFIFLVNIFFLEPLMAKNDKLNAELHVSKTKLTKYLALIKRKDFLQAKYPQFYSDFMTLEKAGQGATDIFMELDGLAKGAHLVISDIRPESSGEKRTGKAKAVEVRTEGTIEAHVKFLYDFENSLSLLRIKRFALNVRPHTQSLEGRFSVITMDAPTQPAGVGQKGEAGKLDLDQ